MKSLILFLLLFFSAAPAFAAIPAPDFTPANFNLMTGRLASDINDLGRSLTESNFTPDGQIVPDFIPTEAKVGRFFIAALSHVARAVYANLLPFLNAFIITLFAFWVLMETWQMMKDKNDVWDLSLRITKKIVVITIWLWILNNNPAELFMFLLAPVIVVGSGLSELILGGTARIIGTNLPDTCAAIHAWIGDDASLLIGGGYAADLLCMTTRVAGFFYTAVAAGFGGMAQGLGSSALTFMLGLIFVILFIYNIWKFALTALGVIVDLFFVLLFLPFTAVKECFANAGDTKYNGVFRPLWDELIGLVKGVSFADQAKKFINAIVYFVILSVMAAISIALLAGTNISDQRNFMSVLIIGCIVAYLIGTKTDELVKKFGAAVDGSVGDALGELIKTTTKNITDWGKKAVESLIKKSK